MPDGDLMVLRSAEVRALLEGQERAILDAVSGAYEAHARGDSALPHSTFLRFPSDDRNRIIALPAYLGGRFDLAGIKWISSFPGNLSRGLERASAVVVLNSTRTGHPETILEGSIVSAKRTAASAALAASRMWTGPAPRQVGLIGCGLISFEVARFLRAVFASVESFLVFDLDPERAGSFQGRLTGAMRGLDVHIARRVEDVLGACRLTSFATTASRPHVSDVSMCPAGTTILHVSLRDLSPEVVLAADNVVDDVGHVCRAETSVHLAEQAVGHRRFIRCTLGDILRGEAAGRRDAAGLAIFSPFGLGVLDLAVSALVRDRALARGGATTITGFGVGASVGTPDEELEDKDAARRAGPDDLSGGGEPRGAVLDLAR